MEENHEWREASDWDDPLQVAGLFQDANSSQCGHAVQWNPRRLFDLNVCPICQQPISFIQQGPNSPSEDDPTIMFKFGKHVYRLLLPVVPDPTPLPSTRSSSSWTLSSSSLSSWFTGPSKSQQQQQLHVQDRIQQSLQLADGFKILHKGKIIYPFSSSTSSSSISTKTKKTLPMTPTSPEEQVSALLLQLSSPSLLLMGTFRGQELSSSPNPSTQQHGPFLALFWHWFQWSRSLMYSTLHSLWIFVISSWTTSSSYLLGGQDSGDAPRPTTGSTTRRPLHDENSGRPHAD